ncbi:MAG TPA: shikimate kinase [Actinomycetes bacterium]
MRRVAVVGNSGSGKTSLGRELARRLAVPFVELDAIHHQPGWRPLPMDEFRRRIAAVVADDGWVIDGNYSGVQDLVWDRADTVIWFDLPRRTVMRRLVLRTLRRAITRADLWNGNREPLSGLVRLDPDRSIIRWAWTQHAKYRHRFSTASTDPRYTHSLFIRIGSSADAARLLAATIGPVPPANRRGNGGRERSPHQGARIRQGEPHERGTQAAAA